MGAISGEELVKLEKMQGFGGVQEEKILVLVRLRPLSEKEVAANEVSDWECINNTTILYRNSLQERSGLPTAYTFDGVFRSDSSTRQVYEEAAKEIALSVVGGINSTIFAYGQTSSGKTYTMNGITEYTVADIYDYINKHEERAFVLKFSAIEIYNEVVRDLLSADNMPLRILDDLEKGTIVEKLTEEILRDWNHLKELLSMCEAQRQIGETSLNETSSRSHQILRLTIESSAHEFLGKDNSTTLVASVNFVDLAGSERASQALSVGQRLKEGCHINRSLLTLGTVIRKLSKGRHGHINYRDSKLTRILQPSLGGNARTAIICTMSPARSHVEQSRNTLLFASCAKEVSTNARVNVVMSDKALVKHLQKEVARLESELKTPVATCDHVALLRKKDQQIEKLEKQVRELTKQRDLAQSRVESLLHVVGDDQAPRNWDWDGRAPGYMRKAGNTLEDEYSVSEPSCRSDLHDADTSDRNFNPTLSFIRGDGSNNGPRQLLPENNREHSALSGGDASCHADGSDPYYGRDEYMLRTGEDHEDMCKEVRCIEMDVSSKDDNDVSCKDDNDVSTSLSNGNEGSMLAMPLSGNGDLEDHGFNSTPSRVVGHIPNEYTYGAPEQKLEDVQKTVNTLVSPNHDERSPCALTGGMHGFGGLKLTRSQSCGANLKFSSCPPDTKSFKQIEKTPPSGLEKEFPGRPEGLGRKHWKFPSLIYGANANSARLLRSDSQSSIGSAASPSMDELKSQNKMHGDEDIPSIHSFVAGLNKMAELQHDQQLGDDQVQERKPKTGRNFKDVGLDPMHDLSGTPLDWPLEFEKLQRLILELWQTCNVSLVHRTYFFLLFKGDPRDSIYMEVEVRRLSFLKGTFSKGNPIVQDGRTLTLASSIKGLRREREMLSRLVHRRFSEEERNRVYQKWGISLDSKRRKWQLVSRLWSDVKDMNHIMESATIVAKLIRFSEQGEALKEMFGLSFTPPSMSWRSFSWKNSMSSLL